MLALIAACSPSGEDADGASSNSSSSAAKAHEGVHACDILTVDFIKEVLGTGDFTPEDQRTPTSARSASTYSSCTVKWKSSKTREMVVMDRTLTVPDENNITLSISIFEPGKGQGVYDVGVNHLKGRNDHEPVSGIGEEAM